MKKIVFLFGFFLAIGLGTATAQCSKGKAACCKSKGTAAVGTTNDAVTEAALVAASTDPSIEKKVCEHSGKVSFHKKAVDPMSGSVSTTEVRYDEAKAQFVSITEEGVAAPAEKKACGTNASGAKACCKKGEKSCSKTAATAPTENVAPGAKVQ